MGGVGLGSGSGSLAGCHLDRALSAPKKAASPASPHSPQETYMVVQLMTWPWKTPLINLADGAMSMMQGARGGANNTPQRACRWEYVSPNYPVETRQEPRMILLLSIGSAFLDARGIVFLQEGGGGVGGWVCVVQGDLSISAIFLSAEDALEGQVKATYSSLAMGAARQRLGLSGFPFSCV